MSDNEKESKMANKNGGCQSGDCPYEADLAIGTVEPKGKSMKHTIYNDPADAPANATRYCILHGLQLAGALAQLSANGETFFTAELTDEGRSARLEQAPEVDPVTGASIAPPEPELTETTES